ncbi:MAG: phosphoribosylanthranilate isomerase [Coriobacteriia bacterium]|nr:phosphoribosylanthranilate isomerase [Coriobacteriia bacterium]
MRRTRIKICGLTRPADAAAAVSSGADALGVLLAPSKRRLTLEQADAVFADVPPLVARIGVFRDATADEVWEAVARLGLTAVQFHGDEAPETCAAAPVPVVKTVGIGPDGPLTDLDRYRGSVGAFLLDTVVGGASGGTGVTFDWYDVAGRLPDWAPVIVAGGLGPHNVAEAIRVLRAYAVDVCSGVEISPGIKDHAMIDSLCAAVRAADLEVADV